MKIFPKICAFAVFLLISMLLFTACGSGDGTEETESCGTEAPAVTLADDAYREVSRREAMGYEMRLFSFAEGQPALALMLPAEWELTQDGDGYTLGREGNTVGSIAGGEDEGDAWKSVHHETSSHLGVTVEYDIEKSLAEVTDGAEGFRSRIRFSYSENEITRTVTLTAAYSEISETCKTRICDYSFLCAVTTDAGIGMLADTDASESILIVGNSFVGSSQVGAVFEELCALNGKHTGVRWISRGYATVATYAKDTALLGEIRSGLYGAVFLCGFYSSDEIEHLEKVKEACDASDTALVIFPAHNESESAVSSAVKTTNGVRLLNWKGELDALIESGVDQWELCVNDAHLHSTPLAGYVGAHMIYRAIFGELPSGSVSGAVDQSTVNAVLGDYADTGTIPTVDMDTLFFLD